MTLKPVGGRAVLLLDNGGGLGAALPNILERAGYEPLRCSSPADAFRAVRTRTVDIALVDQHLGAVDGLDVLVQLQDIRPSMQSIFVAATPDFATAVSAFRCGALDVLHHPLSPDAVITSLETCRLHLRAAADQARTEQRRLRVEKTAAIARFAGNAAHDLNNALTTIVATTDLLQRSIREGHSQSVLVDDVRSVEQAANRARALAQHLLVFGGRQAIRVRTVELAEVLGPVREMLRKRVRAEVDLVFVLEEGLWALRADANQLVLALTNLVVNAEQAIVGPGRITIRGVNLEVPAGGGDHPDATGGRYVAIRVDDTGGGMPPEVQVRAFEPFFSTRGGEARGLGLAVVHGIVRQVDGYVDFDSEVGLGSSFRMCFPAAGTEDVLPRPSAEAPGLVDRAGLRGHESILICEDDEAVRRLTTRALSEAGYDVIAARLPSVALELEERHEGRLDLLITDVVMPEMDGRRLAERIGSRRPEIRVLYVSGHTEELILGQGIDLERVRLLEKPFYIDDLLRTVRGFLDDGELFAEQA